MKNKTVRTVAAGVVAAAMGAASPALADNVKIGALLPMTGDLQAYGVASVRGAELAVKEINAAGGVLGNDVELVIGDTQTNAQAGVDAAQKLVSVSNVSAILGAMASGVTIPVAQTVGKPNKVPQISQSATSPVLTTLDDDGYLFRTAPSDALQGKVLGDLTYDEGFRKVGVLYINNDYGEGLADEFSSGFSGRGGEVTNALAYEPGNASYRGEVRKAAEGGAEALVLIGYPQNGATIIRQALEEGLFTKFIFTDGMKAPELVDAIGGQYLEGSFGTAPEAVADAPGAVYFKDAYNKEFGEMPPKPYIDTAYDAAYLLALAIEKAGSTDGTAIRDALADVSAAPGEKVNPGEWAKAVKLLKEGKDIDYEGASGPVDFDENGDVPGTFAMWAFKDGKVETIKLLK